MNDIEVFIDFEALGIIGRPLGREEEVTRSFLERLPDALLKEGFRVREVWATASVRRRNSRLAGEVQIKLRQAFASCGAILYWTGGIADDALTDEVQKRLSTDALAESVLLIADDRDFAPLVAELLQARRFVLVSGSHVSKRLLKLASRVIPLSELLKQEVPPPDPTFLNPIPIDYKFLKI